MAKSDMERVKQIEAEMQVLADKWHLELIRRQGVDGDIALTLGVTFTPMKDDGGSA